MKQKKNPNASRGHGSGVQMPKSPSWPPPQGPGSRRITDLPLWRDRAIGVTRIAEGMQQDLNQLRSQHHDAMSRLHGYETRGFWAEVWYRLKKMFTRRKLKAVESPKPNPDSEAQSA